MPMPNVSQRRATANRSTATAPRDAEAPRRDQVHLSGTYVYAGGSDHGGLRGPAAGSNSGGAPSDQDRLRFTLHVDIDGPSPLNIVSGTLHTDARLPEHHRWHFIGRVTTSEQTAVGRRLIVEQFTLHWPDSDVVVDRLELQLSHADQTEARAEAHFGRTDQARTYGPFIATRTSPWFRSVEIDIDVETGAAQIEPYDTHLHPDRPAKLPRELLTIERVFADAGIKIVRSPESGDLVDVSESGADQRWSYSELNDSMQLHWDAFANRPQWKAWLLLAGRSERDRLGGVMFDGDIDEPGGVDRQGVAVFTGCEYFYAEDGGYIQMNPPGLPAVRRELLFNTIHELGHIFNLAHPMERRAGRAWDAPAWMRSRQSRRALTWMNYPNSAMSGFGANATWFYKRFNFRFDKHELLYLRHAPEHYVQMGGEAWFRNHARAATSSIDRRLQLSLRSRKQVYELGEPVLVELRLKNVSDQAVQVHRNLDPCDGLVELAVTAPDGSRRPHAPIAHTRARLDEYVLTPTGTPLYESVDLTVGAFGFPFKQPGAYLVEVRYSNLDGSTATATMDLHVRPPATPDTARIVSELFEARVGRVLYVGGTRVMEDVNDKLDWVRQRLGPRHPASIHLTAVRFAPFASAAKVVEPAVSNIHVLEAEPDRVVNHLAEIVIDQPDDAADTFGHIGFRQVVDTFTQSAVAAGRQDLAVEAQKQLVGLFRSRHVLPSFIASVERQAAELDARPLDWHPSRQRASGDP
jgi:hypothetical protein